MHGLEGGGGSSCVLALKKGLEGCASRSERERESRGLEEGWSAGASLEKA